jgi:hypothetical protein
MIGSTVNPALGRIDYSPIVQGAQSAAQSIQNAGQATGQMYVNLGKQISSGFEQYQKNKEERDFYETAVRSRMGQAIQSMNEFKANPQIYGGKAPIRPEMLEGISIEDIPKMSIGKLKSYTNELDNILQESRGALAKANAVRQAEKDIQSIAQNKFLTQAYSTTQGMQVPTGVSTTVKETYRAPTKEEGRINLAGLNYGESVKQGSVVPGVKFNVQQPVTIPDSVKNFIIVNPVTGAAELNKTTVDQFSKISDQALNEKANLRYNIERGTLPDFKIESFGGGVGGGAAIRRTPIERPMTPEEKIAAGNVYRASEQRVSQIQETQKAIDEAQKIVNRDAQGATPLEIKTFISKDPNLTPLQSSSFDLVTKPEFRNATAQEKTDKVLNEYLKQGGELSLDFLAKVKTAFKTDVEKFDLGGGLTAITFGNNFKIMDANEKKPLSIGMTKKIEQDQYQELLNKATRYGSWDRLPEAYKETLASLTAVYGGKDMMGMPISPVTIFNNRLEALRGQQLSQPQNPILSKPSSAPSGWSMR